MYCKSHAISFEFLCELVCGISRVILVRIALAYLHTEAETKLPPFRKHFQLKCIFLKGNAWISLKISLKFVPEVRINNIPALVQIMVWCWPDYKPLCETLMTHICVTRPQWVIKEDTTPNLQASNQGMSHSTRISPKHVYLNMMLSAQIITIETSYRGAQLGRNLPYVASHGPAPAQ